MKKPNILFVLVDQLRRDSVSHYGGPVQTPNLDRLATQGTSFSQAYCVNPMCTPARGAIFTGRFTHALNDEKGNPFYFNNRTVNPDEISIAKSLGDVGYKCGYIGKWHMHRQGDNCVPPEKRIGFDDFWAGGFSEEQYADEGIEAVRGGREWQPDLKVDLAKKYMTAKVKQDDPFFLVVSMNPPHRPYTLPEDKQYLLEQAREQISTEHIRQNVPERLRDQALEEYIQYHANVMGIDEKVGELMDSLEKLGVDDNTLVVFTSDHGENLYGHGCLGKNQFHEEAAAVPMLMRWNNVIESERMVSDFINHTDVLPTLLDLIGTTVPERAQGKSFAAFLRGEEERGPQQSAYLEINHPWWDYKTYMGPQGHRRCLVTESYKLVLMDSQLGSGGAIPWELWDRKNDPYELNNLANDPGYYPLISELVQQMWKEWMLPTDDHYFYDRTLSGLREEYIEYDEE